MVALACVEGAAQVAQAELSQELDPGREIWAACNTRASACDDQQPLNKPEGMIHSLETRRESVAQSFTMSVSLQALLRDGEQEQCCQSSKH